MSDRFDLLVEAAIASLNEARKHLSQEMSTYPTPISGCDAQFNHLLSQRQKVTNALAALDADVFVPTPRLLSPDARMESR